MKPFERSEQKNTVNPSERVNEVSSSQGMQAAGCHHGKHAGAGRTGPEEYNVPMRSPRSNNSSHGMQVATMAKGQCQYSSRWWQDRARGGAQRVAFSTGE